MTFIVTTPDTVCAIREKKKQNGNEQKINENLSHKQTMCYTLGETCITRLLTLSDSNVLRFSFQMRFTETAERLL